LCRSEYPTKLGPEATDPKRETIRAGPDFLIFDDRRSASSPRCRHGDMLLTVPLRRLINLARTLALVLLAVLPNAGQAEPRLITIFTGARSGVYYYAGGTICALVNAHRWAHGIRCLSQASDGSIANLQALRRGAANFAIVQSDWQFHAYEGTDFFANRGPDRSLRSVLALYPEPFTVLAKSSTGIARFSDLKGKRVNLGPVGSGSRATMTAVMDEIGWSPDDFAYAGDLGTGALTQALCNDDIDAAVLVIAHPNLAVEDILSSCDVILVPVDAEITEELVNAHPYYAAYSIPSRVYPGMSSGVDTFTLTATLVTTTQTPPKVVREVAKAIVDALPEFRSKHPSFAEFDVGQMLSQGLSAPMHTAAERYFTETGLRSGRARP